MALLTFFCFLLSFALAQEAPEPAAPEPAARFTVMEVMAVVESETGPVVFLTDQEQDFIVPIWVGPGEGAVIALRHGRRRFERPLTHDLMDDLVGKLGGSFLEVQIDNLLGGTFVATLTVQQGDRTFQVDSRSSDAIAIALGHGLPIQVSQKVIDEAGVKREDLERGEPFGPSQEGGEEQPGGVKL